MSKMANLKEVIKSQKQRLSDYLSRWKRLDNAKPRPDRIILILQIEIMKLEIEYKTLIKEMEDPYIYEKIREKRKVTSSHILSHNHSTL